MKYISRLSQKLAGNRFKWLLFPFPYMLYVFLIGILGFSLIALTFGLFFSIDYVEMHPLSVLLSSLFISLCWLIMLIYVSYKSKRKDLRIVISIPNVLFFGAFLTYLILFSLDFFVDFFAYFFLICLPVMSLYTILILIVYDLTPYHFRRTEFTTPAFANPEFLENVIKDSENIENNQAQNS